MIFLSGILQVYSFVFLFVNLHQLNAKLGRMFACFRQLRACDGGALRIRELVIPQQNPMHLSSLRILSAKRLALPL